MSDEDGQIEDVKEENVSVPTEEASEEVTEEATVAPTKEPEKVATVKEAICSVCGELVTPIVIHTDRGDRYRCPECKKFMKRLSPDDVQSRKRDDEETAYGDDAVLLPPEVIKVNIVKSMLQERLPNIYGIPVTNKKAVVNAVTDTITNDIIRDPRILHAHVKDFAKNINNQHLEALIKSIYSSLSEQGYGSGDGAYSPRYDSIRPEFGDSRHGSYGRIRQDMGIGDQRGDGHHEPVRTMTMMIDGFPVKTTDPSEYLAYQKGKREEAEDKRRRDAHELEMIQLKADMTKGSSGSGDVIEIPNPSGEGTIKIPVHLAPFYMKKDDSEKEREYKREIEAERTKTAAAEAESKAASEQRLVDIIEGLANRPSFTEELASAKAAGAALGMQQGGTSSMDLVKGGIDSLDLRLGQILDRLPIESTTSDFQPQVSRTEGERKAKADAIMDGIDQSESIHGAENALINAARALDSSDTESD